MNMRKWIISAVTLTFALGTAGAITAFAIAAGGGSDNPEVPDGGDIAGEVLHGDPTATSIDDIDPNVCNFIHNINALAAPSSAYWASLSWCCWRFTPKLRQA